VPSLLLFAASPALLGAATVPLDRAQVADPAPPPGWTLPEVAPTAPESPPETTGPETTGPDSGEQGNEIIIQGSYGPPKADPIERVNAESYRLTQAVDQAVVEPLAYAYRDGLPGPLRDGLGNVVRNLGEPANALNFLLQGKVGKAFETVGRLAINSTVGVGGLFDVAGKGAGLPYRRNGFANTMGFYGVGPGPYLYLPVTGATTVRDLIGSTLDQALLPFAVGKPFNRPAYAATYFVVNGLDQRLAFDAEIAAIRSADDPYGVRRDTYLAQRRRDIAALKGEVVPEQEGSDAAEGEAEAALPAPEPANPEALLITQPR
jgi:phospholipid-binding lipoprotein MlaA